MTFATLAARLRNARPASLQSPLRHRVRAAIVVAFVASAAVAPVFADELQDVSRLVSSGKLDDAEKRADAFLAKTPKDAQMRFLKGVILSQRGLRDDAIALFTGLTQDYPELPEPYNNLAVLYAAQGRYDNARDALVTAIRVSPNDATAHENLGDVYAALAARSYRDARRYDANNAAALRKLDGVRAVLEGTAGASAATAAVTPASTASSTAVPDPRTQRNVGMASPAAPSTISSFGAQSPEIVVPSVGTQVPQGSNVVAIGKPDARDEGGTSTLPGVKTNVPIDPGNPIPAINAAVQRWAASRSVRTGVISIRVDGDTAIARFREEPRDARKAPAAAARNRALTLHRNGSGWTVTDDRIES